MLHVLIVTYERSSLRGWVRDKKLLRAGVEVPSGESLMTSPLSKFVHFAADDCRYSETRYDLIPS